MSTENVCTITGMNSFGTENKRIKLLVGINN